MNMGPVFIGGLDRSGKTYMRFMLAEHPSFAISKRTKLWTNYYRKFGDLGSDHNLDRCLVALASQKHIKSLKLDFQQLDHDFKVGPRTYDRLFTLIHQQYANRLGKPRWGDQSELLEKNASQIFSFFPDAKFIHMIRDPRDRYEAVIHKSDRRGGVGAATARWLYSANLANKNQQKFPERYLVVRYESMVSHPEETMRCVCDFLGESYHPVMIRMENESRFRRYPLIDVEDHLSPLSRSYIGRFRENLSDHETFFIQKLTKCFMQKYNYPPEPIQFSKPEIARLYTFFWFTNSVQMIGWRVRNKVVL